MGSDTASAAAGACRALPCAAHSEVARSSTASSSSLLAAAWLAGAALPFQRPAVSELALG